MVFFSRGVFLFYILGVIFSVPGFVFAAESVVYESDFSTDPHWETDQNDNFYWHASSSALFARTENTPVTDEFGVASRYFITQTTLDPTQSFSLSAEMKVDHFSSFAAAMFGLYAEDLTTYESNRAYIQSGGTVNVNPRSLSGNLGYWAFNVVDKDGDNSAGNDGIYTHFKLGIWYEILIEYTAASGTLHMVMQEKESGEVWRELEEEGVYFSEDMRCLGISMHPFGMPRTLFTGPRETSGTAEFLIDNVRLIQVTDEPEEDPIDPLVLEYAPILYLHPDEDYAPMNVGAFIDASSLWERGDGVDTQIYEADELDHVLFESLLSSNNLENHYLAFSDPDTQRSYDLSAAKTVYEELLSFNKATTTVYYHKMEDSFEDDLGVGHEYIVLQYWFFYPFNNWKEYDGYNNHEGDWESVFVFLEANTQEPKYVAFSSHLNDGEANPFDKQYTSVRKRWSEETEQDGKNVRAYVSLGSHANYASSGNHSVVPLVYEDRTSSLGRFLKTENLENISSTTWSTYKGLWGTYIAKDGGDGPQNPQLLNTAGNIRFYEPIKWASIDTDFRHTVTGQQKIFNLPTLNLRVVFEEALQDGAELATDFREEIITIGDNLSELNLLSSFWDISSSLENGEFTVAVTFTYDEDEVEALGEEENVVVYLYNEETGEWEEQLSEVDIKANTVTVETTHFSRYALGVTEGEEEEPEEETITGSSGGGGGAKIELSEDEPEGEVAGAAISTDELTFEELLVQLTAIVEKWKTQGYLSTEDKVLLIDLLNELVVFLANQRII